MTAEDQAHTAQVAPLAEKRRARAARSDDGTCAHCGRARVICSRWGRPCVYSPAVDPDA